MHIGIPFDIETVRQSWGQASRVWGRVVANHDFVRALAAAPGCRRLTLFVPSRQDVPVLERTLVAACGAAAAKIAVVPFARMQAHLAAEPVDVMHAMDPNLWVASHVRNHIAARPFVVTGVTHSLGNQHFLEWALLNDANGVGPGDCLVCTTPTARAVVESAFARLRAGRADFSAPSTTVIPLGVPPAAGRVPRDEARAALGLDAGTFVVLSLARFNPQFKMDLRPVLSLAGLVAARAGRAVRFILAGSSGDGDYARFIRDHAAEMGLMPGCVEFALDPDERRKAVLHGAADVFLSLSDNLQETFGLTVVEAMAAGLPVVASDWDGYRALVEEGVSGFLAPTLGLAPDSDWESQLALRYDPVIHLFTSQATAVDLDAAAASLLRLAGDSGLRERMAAAASDRAASFAWPVVIDRYLRTWGDLLAAAPARLAPARSSALRFSTDFAAYATAQLQPGDRFRATPAGKQLLAGKLPVRLYHDTDEFLDPDLMGQILRPCVEGRTVAQLGQLLRAGDPASMRRIAQNILWLYKNGYLRTG